MNNFHSDAKDTMNMDIYLETVHETRNQEERKSKKIKNRGDSQGSKTSKEKPRNPMALKPSRRFKLKTGMKFYKNLKK